MQHLTVKNAHYKDRCMLLLDIHREAIMRHKISCVKLMKVCSLRMSDWL